MEHEYTIKAAFERMYVCGNSNCSAIGEDTPDFSPGDNRCLMCATTKVHWTQMPFEKLDGGLQRCLRDFDLAQI